MLLHQGDEIQRDGRHRHSDRHSTLDGRPRVVTLEMEILISEGEDILHVGIDNHARQGTRLTGELQVHLVEVVEIDVGISRSVYEIARTKPTHLCHHHAQECIRGYVEGNTQEHIGRTLIELERKAAVGKEEGSSAEDRPHSMPTR